MAGFNLPRCAVVKYRKMLSILGVHHRKLLESPAYHMSGMKRIAGCEPKICGALEQYLGAARQAGIAPGDGTGLRYVRKLPSLARHLVLKKPVFFCSVPS